MIALVLLFPLLLAHTLACWLAAEPLPMALRAGHGEVALEDARGALLREAPGDDGMRASAVPLAAIPAIARAAIVQAEDHQLSLHPGVDPLGIVRAAWLNLRAGRVVAGGSTLAMQLARASYGLSHGWLDKPLQLVRGIALQQRLGADGVLEAYLNSVSFGRDVRGIAEASRAYFDKPLHDLTRGEALALAALPRAPTRHDPYRQRARLLARRDHLLSLLAQRGVISEHERAEIAAEPLHLAPFKRSFRAPHASELARSEAVRRGATRADRLRTSIEPTLQRAAESACARAVQELAAQAATGCAAVVMRVSTGEVLALVGSPDFEAADGGQVNAAVAQRQPGSALKPFLYALAFELGKRPATLIVDEPTRFLADFGSYAPSNYDGRFHGEVTLRQALACSYNVPAVKLALELGPARIRERLLALGLSTLRASAEHYGVGIALGDGEVTLLELTAAYATLARGGELLTPTLLRGASRAGVALSLAPRPRRRVFSREVSYLVSHVLSDSAARRPAFGVNSVLELPFAAAVKTGTSSNYRDNWTLGYAGDFAVGVWVGRHDGAPMLGVSGVSGAGPAFRHLLLTAVGKQTPRRPAAPPGIIVDQQAARRDLTIARHHAADAI